LAGIKRNVVEESFCERGAAARGKQFYAPASGLPTPLEYVSESVPLEFAASTRLLAERRTLLPANSSIA